MIFTDYFSASMMCADFTNLEQEIKKLEAAGISCFHLDLMDGLYVQNFALGFQDITSIRSLTKGKLELHAMIENPDHFIERFVLLGIDKLTVHPETMSHPLRSLEYIKSLDIKAGIALVPATPISFYEPLFDYCDHVLLMSVSPGFTGQSMIKNIDKRIEEALQVKNKYEIEIGLDGAVSEELIKKYERRIDYYVLGTKSLFKSYDYKANVERLRF